MTAPMTRERLAELAAVYEASRRGLSSSEQREALDALGVLLTERESVRDAAWDAAVEAAAERVDELLGNGVVTLTLGEILADVRALKGKR